MCAKEISGGPSRPEDVFSKRASFYAHSKVHDDKETLSWLVELAGPRKDMIVLDVGTGAGHTAMALAPHVLRVEAVDLTEEMLDQGRTLSAQRGIVNIHFARGDAMSLPCPDGSFDIVVCRRAAHHFRDVHKALGEMARVLKPSGRMVIDDRSVPEDEEVDAVINRLDVLHDHSHIRDYRPSEWSSMLEAAGMSVEAMRTYRKRMPLAHFTQMVEASTAEEMRAVISSMSERAKTEVNLEVSEEDIVMDNFFVLLASVKATR